MLNLKQMVYRIDGLRLIPVRDEIPSYIKIHNKVYYFYTAGDENTYFNIERNRNYLIVTALGMFKMMRGEDIAVLRPAKIMNSDYEDDYIVSVQPLTSSLTYVITNHNRIALIDLRVSESSIKKERNAKGRRDIISLEMNELIISAYPRFDIMGNLNSILVVDEENKIKVIDGMKANYRGVRPKKFCDTDVKYLGLLTDTKSIIIGLGSRVTLFHSTDFSKYVKKYNGMFKVHKDFYADQYYNYILVQGAKY